MKKINELFSLDKGLTKNNLVVFSLYKTHWEYNGKIEPRDEPEHIKSWYETEPTEEQLQHEITLNDWTRWNTELFEGQEVEISETVFYHLFGCVPPINVNRGASYFECGEPHHHNNQGKAIHRACWIKDGKCYTGYPKKSFQVI